MEKLRQIQIENEIRPILTRAGYHVLNVEVLAGREPTVRIVIFSHKGVSLDDCARVSRMLDLTIDRFFSGRFRLEVSSPGLERQFTREEEYDLFRGKSIRLLLREPLDGEDTIEGILDGLQERKVRLIKNECILQIPIETIQKARLVFR
jgi:ribosome maturation factor RimP